MKLSVTVSRTIDVKFDPSLDLDEMVKEFNECMFSCDSIEGLVKFTAEQVAMWGAGFVEGIGRVEVEYGQPFGEDCVAKFTIEDTVVETEIL